MKTIYLIGFMGAGKTTIGQELSKDWNLPVFDTDHEIVRTTGKTIPEIFATSGEEFFRTEETKTLKSLPTINSIITTGGGIILREINRRWMKEHGVVIFLDVSVQEVLRRLAGDSTRPLLNEEKEKNVQTLLTGRLPIYQQASHFQISTDGKSIQKIIQEINTCLK